VCEDRFAVGGAAVVFLGKVQLARHGEIESLVERKIPSAAHDTLRRLRVARAIAAVPTRLQPILRARDQFVFAAREQAGVELARVDSLRARRERVAANGAAVALGQPSPAPLARL